MILTTFISQLTETLAGTTSPAAAVAPSPVFENPNDKILPPKHKCPVPPAAAGHASFEETTASLSEHF